MTETVNHPNKEIWKQIVEFPNYEISTTGRIRNVKTGFIRKISIGHRGYPVVSLMKDGKMFLRTVHILLGRTFIDNPENKPQINHIDGNKMNYSLGNLEWCTGKENRTHAQHNGLHNNNGEKKVTQYTLDGKKVCTYKSASEASRQTGISRANISSVARGNTRAKTAKGYKWKYE